MRFLHRGGTRDGGHDGMFPYLEPLEREAVSRLPEDIRERLSLFMERVASSAFMVPDGKPETDWVVLHGNSLYTAHGIANGKPTDSADSATQAALKASRDAAWLAITKRVLDLAEGAMRAPSTAAAGSASAGATKVMAEKASRMLRERAAEDACAYAMCLIVSDLEFPGKKDNWDSARRRWRVWEKGYALLFEREGRLYAYSSEGLQGSGTLRRQ